MQESLKEANKILVKTTICQINDKKKLISLLGITGTAKRHVSSDKKSPNMNKVL